MIFSAKDWHVFWILMFGNTRKSGLNAELFLNFGLKPLSVKH